MSNCGHDELVETIRTWAKAYPLSVFPEPPDGEHGETVDACSARASRHVIEVLMKLVSPVCPETAEERNEWLRRGMRELSCQGDRPTVSELKATETIDSSLADDPAAVMRGALKLGDILAAHTEVAPYLEDYDMRVIARQVLGAAETGEQ